MGKTSRPTATKPPLEGTRRAPLERGAERITIATSAPTRVGHSSLPEVLAISEQAIEWPRDRQIPLYVDHQARGRPLGAVRALAVEDGRLRGTVHWNEAHPDAAGYREDVASGFLGDVSIGYQARSFEIVKINGQDVVQVPRWAPKEASLTGIGADPGAGFGRSIYEGMSMSEETSPAGPPADDGGDAIQIATAQLKKRAREVRDVFAGFETRAPELMQRCLDDFVDAGTARTRLLEHLKTQAAATPVPKPGHIEAGEDGADRFTRGAAQWIRYRSNTYTRADEELRQKDMRELRESEFFGSSWLDLARAWCRAANIDTRGMGREQIAQTALTRAGGELIAQGVSAFTNLLADNINKSLANGYMENTETYRPWVQITSLPDFKAADRPILSTFSDLDQIIADEEYKYGSFSDKKESLTLATYGKLFSISRRAIVNDDQNAFGAIPRAMGRAAARKVGDLVYAVLTDNANMNETGRALFNTTDGNQASSGTAITVANLSTSKSAMALLTDPGGAVLGSRPVWILTPIGKEDGAAQIIQATRDPSVASGESPNLPWIQNLRLIGERRLDAASATAWYLIGDWRDISTVELAFLDGIEAPMLEQVEQTTRDGVLYKIRQDATAAAIDWRNMYKNPGA